MSKKLTNDKYNKILDFKEEEKEYKLYCRGKSKKFTGYTDWKKHILEKLKSINTVEDYNDFKHYCVHRERASKEVPQSFLAIIALFLPIYFELFIDDRDKIWGKIVFIVLLFFLVGYIVYIFVRDTRVHYFYEDLVEIINDNEQQIIKVIESRNTRRVKVFNYHIKCRDTKMNFY